MATETKCAFRDDKDYHDKQEKILKDIDDYKLKEKLREYFIEEVKKCGNGRFGGLYWRELEFNDEYKEKFNPYKGVQVYLYAVGENEIGNISKKALKSNNEINISGKINEFPYDYSEHYLLGEDLQIDTNTGNLIKKDNSFTQAQIWFCQREEHRCILEESHKNEHIDNFKNMIKSTKIKDNLECRNEITKYYIGKYFKELKKQKLVSNEIVLSDDWEKDKEKNCIKIANVIKRLIDARKKHLEA